jgi:ketosteroid isomerase-like protein
MSQDNVEIVRRQFELFSEGDLDESAQDWDLEVVVTPPKGWPEGEDLLGSRRGGGRPSACATPGTRCELRSMTFVRSAMTRCWSVFPT